MPFVLIKGTFFPGVGIPDGDSVRFAADDLSLWSRLAGSIDDPGTNDTVQLRFEGIDSIEKGAIQPLATQSRDSMLDLIGASSIEDTPRGFVLSRSADPNGRPIAFPFAGDAPEADGSEVFLTGQRLRSSVNFLQVQSGFAYPLYYNTLFKELRQTLNDALDEARAAGRGYWPSDTTMSGATVFARFELSQIPPIWPKLWRRLEEFLRNHQGLSGFLDFIRASGERADNLITFEQSSLDNFMQVNGDTVSMTIDPRNLRVVADSPVPMRYLHDQCNAGHEKLT
jgi:endonuclease YncB( thermonuclease family)